MSYQQLADLYLAGTGEFHEDRNPASIDQVLAKFRLATREDVKTAIRNAEEGRSSWSEIPAPKRGSVLFKVGELMEAGAEELARLLTLEEGKTLSDSRAEVSRSCNLFRFYGALAFKHGGITLPSSDENTRIITVQEPLGVTVAITPWNFPLSIPAWKMAPALASGNAVLLKPATKTPLTAAMMIDMLHRAGVPRDVASLVVGPGNIVGSVLAASDEVAAVSFTGSTATGERVRRQVERKSAVTRLQLELGGKNAMYVDKSADLVLAAELAVKGAFGLTGQSCTATSRIIVSQEVMEPLINRMLDRLRKWKVGPGIEPSSNMGPVVDEDQYNKVSEYVEVGKTEGAKVLFDSNEKGRPENGYFVGPTMFGNVSADMRVFRDEIFGPVLSVTGARNEDEAIDLVNHVDYGHTASILSRDHYAINRFIDEIETGVIKVNKPTVGLELQAPFGGFKKSGATTWKEMGEEAFHFYTREKTIYIGY